MNKYQESFENIKNECAKYHNFDIIYDFITLKELVEKYMVLEKALDWACYIISKDCHVMDFDGDERMVCGNAETWKEYLLNEIEKEEKMTGYITFPS